MILWHSKGSLEISPPILILGPFVFLCRELPPVPPTAEWVEIVEPSSRKYIFANLTTGEICWNPPPGDKVYVTPVLLIVYLI